MDVKSLEKLVSQDNVIPFVIGDTPEATQERLRTAANEFMALANEEVRLMNADLILDRALAARQAEVILHVARTKNPETEKPWTEAQAKAFVTKDIACQNIGAKIDEVKVRMRLVTRKMESLRMRYGACRSLMASLRGEELLTE